MSDIKLKMALAYKVPSITKFIDDDLKLIKKLNSVLTRLEKYKKDQYILESVNILRQLDNTFDLNKLYPIICELIDVKFNSTILFLYENLNKTNITHIKKLQELADNED